MDCQHTTGGCQASTPTCSAVEDENDKYARNDRCESESDSDESRVDYPTLKQSLAWSFDDSVDEPHVAGIYSCIMTPLLQPMLNYGDNESRPNSPHEKQGPARIEEINFMNSIAENIPSCA
jgi:hypothetical protein